MTYFVTYLKEGTYKLGSEFSCASKVEAEVSKEIYEYLNKTFGSMGRFTFRTGAVEKTKPKKTETKPKVEDKKPVTKVTKKTPKD